MYMNVDIKLAKIVKVDEVDNDTSIVLYIDNNLYRVKYKNYQINKIINNSFNHSNIFAILLDNNIIGYSLIDKSNAILTIDDSYLNKYNISYYDFCKLVEDKIKYRGLYVEKFKFKKLEYDKDHMIINVIDNNRVFNIDVNIDDKDYHYIYLLRNLNENDSICVAMDDDIPFAIIFNDIDLLVIKEFNGGNNIKRICNKYGIKEDDLDVLLYKLIYDQNNYFHIDNRHV